VIDQAELPIFDWMPPAPPFVGPGKCNRSARSLFEGCANVHRGDLCLAVVALPNAVGARFSEQERFGAGNVL
jgi:hypothetical protein